MNEYGYHDKYSAIYYYITNGEVGNYLLDLMNSNNSSTECGKFDRKRTWEIIFIIYNASRWDILLFKEAWKI